MDSLFTFGVDCTPEMVSVKAFSTATDAFFKLLSKAKATNWRVTSAKIASVHLSARPNVMDNDARDSMDQLDAFAEAASDPSQNIERIHEFQPVIEKISDVSRMTNGNIIIGVGGREHTLTPADFSKISKMLQDSERRSFGHVSGRVDKIILQQSHRSLGLIDRISGVRVEVKFTKHLDDDVKVLTPGILIDVKGFVKSSFGSPISVEAEDIETVKITHGALVTSEDLENLIAVELPKDVDSVSLVRSLRDVEE